MLAADFTPASVALLVVSAAFAIAFACTSCCGTPRPSPISPRRVLRPPSSAPIRSRPRLPEPAREPLQGDECSPAAATLVDLCDGRSRALPGRTRSVRGPHPARARRTAHRVRGTGTSCSCARRRRAGRRPSPRSSWTSRSRKHGAAFREARRRRREQRGLLRGRWTRVDWWVFGVLVAGVLVASRERSTSGGSRTPATRAARASTARPGSWSRSHRVASAMAALRRLRSIRYSASGTGAAARWLGVKRFLGRDAQFGETPPAGVAIWDRLPRTVPRSAPRTDGCRDPTRGGGPRRRVGVASEGRGTRCTSSTRCGSATARSRRRSSGRACCVRCSSARSRSCSSRSLSTRCGVGIDAFDDLGDGDVLVIVLVFVAVFGAMGAFLVIRLADGIIRLVRGRRSTCARRRRSRARW